MRPIGILVTDGSHVHHADISAALTPSRQLLGSVRRPRTAPALTCRARVTSHELLTELSSMKDLSRFIKWLYLAVIRG